MYRKVIKRFLDIIISFVGISTLALPMLIIAIVVKIDSKGPVFFRQVRLAQNQKTFKVNKFRTMVDRAYEFGGIATRSDDNRITRVGVFLRRTSLDEVPQLFNVLLGQMAIIGPRPILPIEFEEYKDNPIYCKRYSVRQGMFCTVDIEYRASCSRELQFEMDVDYSDNITFIGDVKIFFSIIKTVLTGKNVYKKEVTKQTDQEIKIEERVETK